jgi:hypothetical protein
VPRSRIFPWIINSPANGRKSISFGPLTGLVVVKRMTWQLAVGVDPPNSSLELGNSPVRIQENNVALTTSRAYNVITELQDPFAYGAAGMGAGYPLWTLPNTHAPYEFAPNIIIPDMSFFLVVALVNQTGGAVAMIGHVTLIEGLTSDQVAAAPGAY